MDKSLRSFRTELEGEKLKLVSLERTGRSHYKAVIEGPDGKTMLYFMAATASDRRAARNRLSDIKRFFNN